MSTQQIKKGTKLFDAEPLIVGPPIYSLVLSCIHCDVKLSRNKWKCKTCSTHFCTSQCLSSHSKYICNIIESLPSESKSSSLILPIKAFALEQSEPAKFERFKHLQSHSKDIQESERWQDLEKRIVNPLCKTFPRDLIIEICGVIATNSFEISENQIGVYDLPSMMNHDCVGNTRLVISGERKKILVFSSINIEKNCPILFNYGRALDSSYERKKQLKEFKFFECTCQRCSDPTELGTFIGALKCQTCPSGAVVNINDYAWKCMTCEKAASKEDLQRAFGIIRTEKSRFNSLKSQRDLKSILCQLQRYLYPTHGFIIELKLLLIQIIRPDMSRSETEMESVWREKLRLCEDVMEVLNIVEPGLSLNRGLVLHEIQAALVHLANVEFERDTNQTSKLQKTLQKARNLLRETKVCLDMETSDTVEAQARSETIRQEQQELDNYIELVANI